MEGQDVKFNLVVHPDWAVAPSWEAKHEQEVASYRVQARLEALADIARRAARSLTDVHRYITETGPHHPALEQELRLIEDTVAVTTRRLITRYMDRT
jgi:hypothetical protein